MNPIDMNVTDLNCEYLGLSRLCLMESAGKSLAEEVGKIAVYTFSKPVKIIIFTGSGGNGGDGFVAARYLLNRGYDVEIYMLKDKNGIHSNEAKTNFEILENMKPRFSRLTIHNLKTLEDINNCEVANTGSFSEFIIIDAILGTGINGKLKENIKQAIEVINKSNGLTVSVDVPSGLDPLTGEICDVAVKPQYTVSFHKVKTGIHKAGEEKVGGIVTCDIGIPIEAEYFINYGDMIKLSNRSKKSHKGNNGKVLIVGGSKEYSGAPVIAGLAAIGAGADLVYVAAPSSVSLAISTHPDLIVKSLEGDYLTTKHSEEILELAENVDAVLLGPGAGINEETSKLLNILASKIKKPLVLDADALKQVELQLIKNKENLIITPHIFEFKSFFGKEVKLDLDSYDFNKVDENISKFQEIVREINGVVVVKGEIDLVMQKNNFKLNKSGNPGMTVGGTGDALAGMATSFLSQGLNAFDGATLAIFINGLAGDEAYLEKGYGFGATDLISHIGSVIKNKG